MGPIGLAVERPLSLSMDSMSDLVRALSSCAKTLISWPGCWLGVGTVPMIHAPSFIIIIDAGLSWKHCSSCGSMLEDAVPIIQSAYSIQNFVQRIYGIG